MDGVMSFRKAASEITRRDAMQELTDRIVEQLEFRPHRGMRRRMDAEVWAFATKRRAERLAKRSKAEIKLAEILDGMAVRYEEEYPVQNGDSCIHLDFYIPSAKLCMEADGLQHEHWRHRQHDQGRDAWLLQAHGVRTVRLPASVIFRKPRDCVAAIRAAMQRIDSFYSIRTSFSCVSAGRTPPPLRLYVSVNSLSVAFAS
jgi:very-short-patch-repair endonuclease